MVVEFPRIGIRCVKNEEQDIKKSLETREGIHVDPFKQGFQHKTDTFIDLNSIRLSFEVILAADQLVIPPTVSHVIWNKKAHRELSIIDYGPNYCLADKEKKVLVFCEKVSKDDIMVHLEFPNDGKLISKYKSFY